MMSDELEEKNIKSENVNFGNMKEEYFEDFNVTQSTDHEKNSQQYKDFEFKKAFDIKKTKENYHVKDIDMMEKIDYKVTDINNGDNRHYIFIKEELHIKGEKLNLLEYENVKTRCESLVEAHVDSVGIERKSYLIMKKNSNDKHNASDNIEDSFPSTSQDERCHKNRIDGSSKCFEDLVSKSQSSKSQNSLQSLSEPTRLSFSSLGKSPGHKMTFECSECNFRTFRKDHIACHNRIHTGEKPFKCTFCNYRASDNSSIIKHTIIHTGEKPFKCTCCDYRTSNNSNLRDHIKTHTGEKPYQCYNCDYSASTKRLLQKHIKIHTEEKPFECNYCDYRTLHRSGLQKHLRIHTGEKPFKCTYCDYRTSNDSNLRDHIKTHTGEKPFKCNDCNYSSSRKTVLLNHTKVHTGEKLFECNNCDFKTSFKSSLRRHFRIHTDT